jgi:restriction system protein
VSLGTEGEKLEVVCDFVTYAHSQDLLLLFDDASKALVDSLTKSINRQRGTPQQRTDWSDPEDWIPERLEGQEADLATRLWRGSQGRVNPRYISLALLDKYELWRVTNGKYQVTDQGQRFLANDKDLLREIDEQELLFETLNLLAGKPRSRMPALLPAWTEFLNEHTALRTRNTVHSALLSRLKNLIDRGYVEVNGQAYDLSPTGREYLEGVATDKSALHVYSVIEKHNRAQREKLIEQLMRMKPYDFERLVMELLDSMGYVELELTTPTNDNGVDVIGFIDLGISRVKEVVQVKRSRGSVGRPIVDQLRGSLHRFHAIRGMIVTLGTFPKRCQETAMSPGVAPITLVDGEKLVDLLFQHGVGVQPRQLQVYELDDEYFSKYQLSENTMPSD